jgi:excisionase family DNA binding protein
MTDQTEHIARAYSQQSGELRYQLDMLEAQRARLDRVFFDHYAPNLSLNPGVADLLSELLDSIRDVADRTREQVDVLVAAAEVRVGGSGDVARGVGGFAEFSGDVGVTRTRRWATTFETATYLQCGERTVRRMIADGRIPAYRVNARLVRLDLDEVDAAITGQAMQSAATAVRGE